MTLRRLIVGAWALLLTAAVFALGAAWAQLYITDGVQASVHISQKEALRRRLDRLTQRVEYLEALTQQKDGPTAAADDSASGGGGGVHP